jgi:hypothetical protein
MLYGFNSGLGVDQPLNPDARTHFGAIEAAQSDALIVVGFDDGGTTGRFVAIREYTHAGGF